MKKLIHKLLEVIDELEAINEMAISRQSYVSRMSYLLKGALQEYTKLTIARDLKLNQSSWENETKKHFSTLRDSFLLRKKSQLKGVRDKKLAYQEAVQDALDPSEIADAKAHLIKIHPKKNWKIKTLPLHVDDLMNKMLSEFKEYIVFEAKNKE